MSKVWAHGEIETLRLSHHAWEQCGPCFVFACSTLAFTLQLRKKSRGKTSVRVVKKCQLGTIDYVDMATFWQVVTTSLLTPVSLGMLEKTCVNTQRRYLPRGSSSANCESNLLVKALMWSAKNATPKSLRICLLQCTRIKSKQCEDNWTEACSFLA